MMPAGMTGEQAAMRQAAGELRRARLVLKLHRPRVRHSLEAMSHAVWLMQSVASSRARRRRR